MSGTKTFSFTISLSAPAPATVTFDIATQDNTATLADNDYVERSLTSQTISAGNSTYTFDVTVNGDTNIEPDESFFSNVSNVSGATVSDGQGLAQGLRHVENEVGPLGRKAGRLSRHNGRRGAGAHQKLAARKTIAHLL